MNKREIIMLTTLSFSVGIIIGFLTSPIKKGITNVAGNTTNHFNKAESEEAE